MIRPDMAMRFSMPCVSIGLTIALTGCAGGDPPANPDPNHTHADFAVYIDEQRLDFAQQKYMSEVPRKNDLGVEAMTEIPGRKNLHLHDMNGSVAHRHKPGLTVGDFFRSIGFTMEAGCFTSDDGRRVCNTADKRWRMFVNDAEVAVDPAYAWNDLDRILLTYGAADEQIQSQLKSLTDDACLYSRVCPERGDPPTENCIADPEVPCTAPTP